MFSSRILRRGGGGEINYRRRAIAGKVLSLFHTQRVNFLAVVWRGGVGNLGCVRTDDAG